MPQKLRLESRRKKTLSTHSCSYHSLSKGFLLIVRTGRIFTHDTIGVAPDTTEFPAYSQVLQKQLRFLLPLDDSSFY